MHLFGIFCFIKLRKVFLACKVRFDHRYRKMWFAGFQRVFDQTFEAIGGRWHLATDKQCRIGNAVRFRHQRADLQIDNQIFRNLYARHPEKNFFFEMSDQLRFGVVSCLEKAELARSYAKRNKRHTALIIIVSIVDFMKTNIAACLADKDKKARTEFAQLVEETRDLMRLRVRRNDDASTMIKTKAEFEKLLAGNMHDWNDQVVDAEDSNSDGTECSCDDCHNHTCSTYGPLGGCRRARTRD